MIFIWERNNKLNIKKQSNQSSKLFLFSLEGGNYWNLVILPGGCSAPENL